MAISFLIKLPSLSGQSRTRIYDWVLMLIYLCEAKQSRQKAMMSSLQEIMH
jgi:hypothetical protein